MLDCTADVSHADPMKMLIQFVKLPAPSLATSKEGSSCNQVLVKEHFLGFMLLKESTIASMTKVVIEKLKDMSLPVQNIRGQGYDNGSNMRGKKIGLQNRILDVNPRVLCTMLLTYFEPCSQRCSPMLCGSCNLFDVVQQTYV